MLRDVDTADQDDCYRGPEPSGSPSFAGDTDEPSDASGPGGSSRRHRAQSGVESLARLFREPIPEAEVIWRSQAACLRLGAANSEFFPSRGQSGQGTQTRWCDVCPVVEPCLEWAIDHRVPGVWGGTNEQQRDEIRRDRARVVLPKQLAFAL